MKICPNCGQGNNALLRACYSCGCDLADAMEAPSTPSSSSSAQAWGPRIGGAVVSLVAGWLVLMLLVLLVDGYLLGFWIEPLPIAGLFTFYYVVFASPAATAFTLLYVHLPRTSRWWGWPYATLAGAAAWATPCLIACQFILPAEETSRLAPHLNVGSDLWWSLLAAFLGGFTSWFAAVTRHMFEKPVPLSSGLSS